MSKQPPSPYPHDPPPQPSNTGYSSDTTVSQDVSEPKAFNEPPSKHRLGMLAHNLPYPHSMNVLADKNTLPKVNEPFYEVCKVRNYSDNLTWASLVGITPGKSTAPLYEALRTAGESPRHCCSTKHTADLKTAKETLQRVLKSSTGNSIKFM